VDEVGIFTKTLTPIDSLEAGDVGYITASIKDVADTRVGDTITDDARPANEPLPGYKKSIRWYSAEFILRTGRITKT
jgi:GTP-binding protein LepA